MADGVHGLPGNKHRHNGGLTGTGRELEGEAQQLGIGPLVGALEMRPELADAWPKLRRDLGQPDRRLDCLDLAEEGSNALPVGLPPVLQQPCRLGRDEPLVRVRQVTPRLDVGPHLVDDRRRIVFLLVRRKPRLIREEQLCLPTTLVTLLRLRHRGDEVRSAPCLDDAVRGLSVGVEFPMPAGKAVGRVENKGVQRTAAPCGPAESDPATTLAFSSIA